MYAYCQKRCNDNILGTVWSVKLKPIGLVVRDVEIIKSKYLHPNATASTHTTFTISITTTATKAYATTINATDPTTTTVIKTKDINTKNLGYIKTIWN